MLVVKELKDYLFMLMIILWVIIKFLLILPPPPPPPQKKNFFSRVKIKNYDIEIDGRSF